MNSLINFKFSTPKVSINEVNKLSQAEFVEIFGHIIENVPQAAFLISASKKHFHNIMDLYCAFCDLLDEQNLLNQVFVLKHNSGLKKHLPKLTDLTPKDVEVITSLIDKYERRFGFTFVICEKEKKTGEIVKAILQRFQQTKLNEVRNGMEEVKKIIKYRILQIIKHEYA